MVQRKTEFRPALPIQQRRSPGHAGETAGDLAALQRLADQSPVTQRLRDVQALAAAGPVQREAEAAEMEEEEPVQGKLLQAAGLEDEEPLQGKAEPNGLPAQLRAGVERLSGISMDGVTVHRNSAAPAEVGAHAYAQGRDIHLAPGQERHLPHEAWHVAQQAQGRVQPTVQAKGVAINDDAGLEAEADAMGQKALQSVALPDATHAPAQRVAVTQRMGKPAVTDGKLANIVNALFKGAPSGGSVIGDGSAFAACSHEVGGGDKVGGRNHEGKIQDIQRGLEKLQSKHDNPASPVELSEADLLVVATLLTACDEALKGTYAG